MINTYRHAIQATTILACMVWGGYQITTQALAQPIDSSAVSNIEVEQDLATLYPNLSPEVARAISSVVATQQILDAATGEGIIASGVIINDNQILTAGHNVEGTKGLACSQTNVVAPGLLSDATASKDGVTHASVKYGSSQDMAVLTLNSSENFQALPDVTLAKRQPKKGETVYFVNFQPTADGKVRSPASLASVDTATDYSKPVVFSGTVLGSSDNGLAIAAGHGKSFSRGAPDTMLRKGASGGAVVNSKGELVGLSVSSESLKADTTASSIKKDFHLQMPESSYQVAYMQPITKSVVGQLQSSMVSCDSTR